jgi:hypothetical protein
MKQLTTLQNTALTIVFGCLAVVAIMLMVSQARTMFADDRKYYDRVLLSTKLYVIAVPVLVVVVIGLAVWGLWQ